MARQAPIAISGSDTTIRGTMVHAINAVPLFPCAVFAILGAYLGLTFSNIANIVWLCLLTIGAILTATGAWSRTLHRRESLAANILVIGGVTLTSLGLAGYRASQSPQLFAEPDQYVQMNGIITKIQRVDSAKITAVFQIDTLWLSPNVNAEHSAPLPYPTSSEKHSTLGHKGIVTFRLGAQNDKRAKRSNSTRASYVSQLRPGTRISLFAHTAEPFCDPFSDFDYQAYLQSQGLSFLAYADSFAVKGREVSLSSIIGNVNQWFALQLKEAGLRAENIAFLQALVLADRSEMSSELRRQFAVCGTAHVLAVSGMHVGLLACIMMWLLTPMVGKRWAAGVALIVVWVYVVLVGMAPPVVRAAVMFSFVQLAHFTGYRISGFHGLTVAICLIVFADPLSVLSVGFWLSFAAVAGLMSASALGFTMQKGGKEGKKWWAKLGFYFLSLLWASFVAQAATAPIILYSFHSFPTYFWLNNLVVGSLITAVFAGALLCSLLGGLPFGGSMVGWAENSLLDLLTNYCSWASGLPMASVDCGGFGMGAMVGSALVVVALCYAMRGMRLSQPMVCYALAGLLIVAADGLSNLWRNGLIVYVARGETSVTIYEQGHMIHFQPTLCTDATTRAMEHITREARCTACEIMPLERYITFRAGERTVCVVSDTSAMAIEAGRGADIVIVNADIMPEEFSFVDKGAKTADAPTPLYVITPRCSVAGAWRVRQKNCRVLEWNDVWEME